MFRLAHISDPHLGPLPDPTVMQLASKRIFGYVNWRRNRKGALVSSILEDLISDIKAQAPDHLAVTGDLVNLALPAEISNARLWLDSLGEPRDVSVIPGNHDAYVPRSRHSAEKSWAPFISGDTTNPDEQAFPYLRVRNNVALIGVNSARATMPLMATGYFLSRQARHLRALLQACDERRLFRVVMIHHPPCRNATHWYKRLIGASRFREVIKDAGAELILHGHTHYPTRMQVEGPYGEVPVICVPSASQGPGAKKPPARYNLFEIDGEQGAWTCQFIERGYTSADKGVGPISNQPLAIPNG